MNKEIFREYDIRGIWEKDITVDMAYTIGRSFASYIKDKTVLIGHDNRLSSPIISESLIDGLLSSGANVIDLGLCTTPMYYALKKHLDITNGIMITASHNPKEYNGFKISFSKKGNACGKEIFDFRDFTLNNNFIDSKGTYEKYENTEEIYLNLIKNNISLGNRKINVAIDTGNGTAGIIVRKVFDMFNNSIKFKLINEKSDGDFPNHHPDPCVPENMNELSLYVKKHKCDLGIGIDGDADRVGIVDNNGNLIAVDKLMIIIYKYLLPHMHNKKAIMDVKCSKAIIDFCETENIPLEIYRTGNSYMNLKINNDNYDFGGEFSGHLWFCDKWIGTDDGIYNGLRVIEILSNINENLNTLLNDIPNYYNTPEIKIEIDDNKKDLVINKIKDYCDDKNITYNDIDGVRIDYDDGFALIRKSNTGPNITLRFEKKDEKSLDIVKNEFINLINEIKKEL